MPREHVVSTGTGADGDRRVPSLTTARTRNTRSWPYEGLRRHPAHGSKRQATVQMHRTRVVRRVFAVVVSCLLLVPHRAWVQGLSSLLLLVLLLLLLTQQQLLVPSVDLARYRLLL
jgi:hypothetical protein